MTAGQFFLAAMIGAGVGSAMGLFAMALVAAAGASALAVSGWGIAGLAVGLFCALCAVVMVCLSDDVEGAL